MEMLPVYLTIDTRHHAWAHRQMEMLGRVSEDRWSEDDWRNIFADVLGAFRGFRRLSVHSAMSSRHHNVNSFPDGHP